MEKTEKPDNSEVLQKLDTIEVLLMGNIKGMEKIVKDANDPEKRAKEAEILIQASKDINSATKEIAGLVSKESTLIGNFNPTVESKHYYINAKNPMWWIIATVFVMVASSFVCYEFYKEAKSQKAYSDNKFENFMKYRYLKVYGSDQVLKEIKDLDKLYESDPQNIIDKTMERERKQRQAKDEAALAKVKQQEAKQLKQHSDSLLSH